MQINRKLKYVKRFFILRESEINKLKSKLTESLVIENKSPIKPIKDNINLLDFAEYCILTETAKHNEDRYFHNLKKFE